MVMPYDPVAIVSIPGMGEHCAVYACEQLKVVSQNDKQKLEQAKEMTYLKAFYEGVREATYLTLALFSSSLSPFPNSGDDNR